MTDDTRSPYEAGSPDPTDRVKQEILGEIRHLRELMDARLDAADQRFEAFEQRMQLNELARIEQKADTRAAVVEQKADTREAVQAALAAQESAVAKSEAGFAREVAQIKETIGDLRDSVALNTSDIKAQAAVKTGGQEQRTAMYAFAGFVSALVVIGAFVLALWPS